MTQASDFKVAVVTTLYRHHAHADVIVSRWLEPRPTDPEWGWPGPRTRIESMYVAQFDDDDMARDMCAKHGVTLHDNVADAVRGADAVLLIGEHGEYPDNELGQKLYPRKELFDEITAAFRDHGRVAPVFCDKFLSWNFDWAKQMVATAEQMGFVLTSSSSIPLCLRVPQVELGGKIGIEEGVAIFYGGDEVYGYHGYEFVQAIVERRAGGETGVEGITVYQNDEVWRQWDAGRWSNDLAEAALAAIVNQDASRMEEGDLRTNCDASKEGGPTAFCLDYADGTRMTHLNLSGHVSTWGLAIKPTGGGDVIGTAPKVGDADNFHGHFATMSRIVEDALVANRPPFSPLRPLMTTGLTAMTMHARANPGVRMDTPQLAIEYNPFDYPRGFSLNDA